MLFMKGSPREPKCGFSRQIVQILDSYNADYNTFDILTDNDIREGLKKYSNWPTYPQVISFKIDLVISRLVIYYFILMYYAIIGYYYDLILKLRFKSSEEKILSLELFFH